MLLAGDMFNTEFTIGNPFSDKMKVHFDVFHLEQRTRYAQIYVVPTLSQYMNGMSRIDNFNLNNNDLSQHSSYVANWLVLYLGKGSWNCPLLSWNPWNGFRAKKHNVSRCGSTIIMVPSPIYTIIGMKRKRSFSLKIETILSSTF